MSRKVSQPSSYISIMKIWLYGTQCNALTHIMWLTIERDDSLAIGNSIFICKLFFLFSLTHIAFNSYNLKKKSSFQQFPLLPKQMSDISGFPSAAHEASRRITLLVFLTNVRYIKNSTPQTGVTEVHAELIVNINRVAYKSHIASTRLTCLRDDVCWQWTKGLCECVSGPVLTGMCGSLCVCVKKDDRIYVSGTMSVCKRVFVCLSVYCKCHFMSLLVCGLWICVGASVHVS